MEHIREYILSVTAAAMICSVIRCFCGEKGVIPLLCGIFLLLSVIRPLANININALNRIDTDFKTEADNAVAEGKDYAQAAIERRITEQYEAYILDKAKALGCSISVNFIFKEYMSPPVCIIQGELSSYAKEQLSEILESDLGIPREEQRWIP